MREFDIYLKVKSSYYNSFNMLMISIFINLELRDWFRLLHLLLASSVHELGSEISQTGYRLEHLLPRGELDDEQMMQRLQRRRVRVQVGLQVLPLTVLAQGAQESPPRQLAAVGLRQLGRELEVLLATSSSGKAS